MCIGCGNTCGGAVAAPPAPRFTTAPKLVRPEFVGTAFGPDLIPDVLIRQQGQLITYETLYAGLSPNGQPAAVVIPGSYGQYATRAGRR